MQSETFRLIHCQECLHQLTSTDHELVCNHCGKMYPIHNGLVFMGYDSRKEQEINEIIEEERDHQNNLDEIDKHFEFAQGSFRIALLAIPLLRQFINDTHPVALDVGSGGAPFSQILSDNGFNTYRLELDPNSLYSGLFYQHSDLVTGKHIVADGSLLPFANNSVDVVFCKEFIHHIEEYNHIFAEVNRVLKPGGIFLMIEPTNKFSFLRTEAENESIHRPGHHLTDIFSYARSLHKNGFRIKRYYLYHYKSSLRFKILNKLKASLINQIKFNQPTRSFLHPFKMFLQRVISGQNVIYAQKMEDSLIQAPRASIKVVEPSQLVIDESYIKDSRLEGFNKILRDLKLDLVAGTE